MKGDSGLKIEVELESKFRASLGENRYSVKAVFILLTHSRLREEATAFLPVEHRNALRIKPLKTSWSTSKFAPNEPNGRNFPRPRLTANPV